MEEPCILTIEHAGGSLLLGRRLRRYLIESIIISTSCEGMLDAHQISDSMVATMDSALPAAVPLRVSTQPQPPQPRKAALPAPGSAGAMSRKQANAFFSAARPREPTPAGADIAADATDTGAGAGPAPAAAPTPDAAAAAGSPQQPCSAPLDFLPMADPVKGAMDLATDGDGDGAAPPPPLLHSPPAAHEASSPAVSPLPMASLPPPPPPGDLDKVCAAACEAADDQIHAPTPTPTLDSCTCAQQHTHRQPLHNIWDGTMLGSRAALCC